MNPSAKIIAAVLSLLLALGIIVGWKRVKSAFALPEAPLRRALDRSRLLLTGKFSVRRIDVRSAPRQPTGEPIPSRLELDPSATNQAQKKLKDPRT